jgi:apolipoprotein D and lipocalin family protein
MFDSASDGLGEAIIVAGGSLPRRAQAPARVARALLLCLAALALSACAGIPEGVKPVHGLDVERYLGTWYEVARLDHRFERGLSRVTATYTRRDDGGIDLINRGYDAEAGEWREADGKAYFVGEPDVGHLKVSFFGPFYGYYIVFELDPDYRHAFIAGYSTDYLWLLARDPDVGDDVVARFEARAAELGFDTDALIYVAHD